MNLPDGIPGLVTPRLALRACVPADALAVLAVFSDPEVMRYWSTPPWNGLADAEAFLQRAKAQWEAGAGIRWVLDERGGDRAVGTVTLFALHPGGDRAEVGFALRRASWGRGYMREALTSVLDWAFGAPGLRRVEADVDPRNEASVRTLERLGFAREGLLRERWEVAGEVVDSLILGLLRREWRRGAAGR
ncbi:MAG TPA: GNAT family protein [Anaeromyxobacter sp.]|nr:GNAT family protein [Anaeromyxobacter sp.]